MLLKFTQKYDFFYINMCKNGFKMCKSKIKITQHITQQLEAEGHLLDMVGYMKGYTALIVDIIGLWCFKATKLPNGTATAIQNFLRKKRKTFIAVWFSSGVCIVTML